jgi:hypothetical protein
MAARSPIDPAFGIFYLKAKHQWKDKVEVFRPWHTGKLVPQGGFSGILYSAAKTIQDCLSKIEVFT